MTRARLATGDLLRRAQRQVAEDLLKAGLLALQREQVPTALDHASREREEAAWADGIHVVVGCDEAGRGPLAGPVVAAACMLPAAAAPIPGVGDSKAITDEAMREALR